MQNKAVFSEDVLSGVSSALKPSLVCLWWRSPQYALQNKGVFNEELFRGLDYALDTARRFGIKVRQSCNPHCFLILAPLKLRFCFDTYSGATETDGLYLR